MSHAIITGAGSGVGRATALALAARGWTVTILGRRAEALAETARLAGPDSTRILPLPVDIADAGAVATQVPAAIATQGGVQVLVNAAGTNLPRRNFTELSLTGWQEVFGVNLHGTYHLVAAVLPTMRRQGAGTIVNIVSDAGQRANAKAGPAYVASKFAVTGLTQALNCEERLNGIRATAIFPGDIDTPLLERRPVPPPASARLAMLQAEDVAACALLAIDLPQRAVIEELLVRPRAS